MFSFALGFPIGSNDQTISVKTRGFLGIGLSKGEGDFCR